MSTTQTSHEPGPAELDAHAIGDHAAAGHGGNGHGDDGVVLGPVDLRAWGALLLGVAAGLLVVLCLVITTALLRSTPPG